MEFHSQQCESLNCPEENDETLSEMFQSGPASADRSPPAHRAAEGLLISHDLPRSHHDLPRSHHDRPRSHHDLPQSHHDLPRSHHDLPRSHHDLPRSHHDLPRSHHDLPRSHHDLPRSPRGQCSRYDQWTPYPSQADPNRTTWGAPCTWHYSSYPSRNPEGCYPSSLPSYLPSTDHHGFPGDGGLLRGGPRSLPGISSPELSGLEQPGSLRSVPPAPSLVPHHVMPGLRPCPPCCGCCGRCGPLPLRAALHLSPGPGAHLPLSTGRGRYRAGLTGISGSGLVSPGLRQSSPGTSQLSQEQRRVFVTYEADSEDHLKEIIKFVALLRNNGFDTHIDVFEQQLISISKIDCMERYLNQKDYLIIIIISLKYYETVTGFSTSSECDERTSNTVYIHKQLQNEFIQNGCRNFRFIPVLFPGAKKSYIPSWLQNTNVYSWPQDRDDILRRLLRVEKYKPPPIGPLPDIVPVPI